MRAAGHTAPCPAGPLTDSPVSYILYSFFCPIGILYTVVYKYTLLTLMILCIAGEDSYSRMRTRKLVPEAMVKPAGYYVHSVHIAVIINIPNCKLVTGVCMSWSSLCLFTS